MGKKLLDIYKTYSKEKLGEVIESHRELYYELQPLISDECYDGLIELFDES